MHIIDKGMLCIHIYVCVYISIRMYVYTYIYIYIHTHTHVCMHIIYFAVRYGTARRRSTAHRLPGGSAHDAIANNQQTHTY